MGLDGSALRVYCRGTDLSTALQSTTLEQTREEDDATVYASAIRTLDPTLGRVTLAHAGLYGDGPFSAAEVFRQARDTDDEPVTLAPEGAIAGTKAFIVLAHKATITQPASATPGKLHRMSLRAASRSRVADGVVAFSGAIGGDAPSAGFLLGALSASQVMRATIHLLAITPVPSVTFFLESDDAAGFASPTIRATSAAQTARGSVLLAAAGPITDPYWRVRWDHAGTGNFTALIALGLAG